MQRRGERGVRVRPRGGLVLTLTGMAVIAAVLTSCGSGPSQVGSLAAAPAPKASGPPVCQKLANGAALRQLPAALTDVYTPAKHAAVVSDVTQVTAELQQLASSAPPALASAMAAAASTTSALSAPMPTPGAIAAEGAALTALATAVQSVCHFSTSAGS
jgi:hypothetical protein